MMFSHSLRQGARSARRFSAKAKTQASSAPMSAFAAGGVLAGLGYCANVASADTVIEISNASTTVKITMDGEGGNTAEHKDMNYPPYGISDTLSEFPEWIKLGCGDEAYNCPLDLLPPKNSAPTWGATWAVDGKTPNEMPDLSGHSNHMSDVLKADPGIYHRLKNKVTKSGVTLAHCMKTGIDNVGHPHIKLVGMVAGDEESYETFAELFDPVISDRHGGYGPDGIQPTNLDISKLSNTDIDPDCKYVLTTRVRTGRSVRGFKLPPQISFEDRRKLEGLVTEGLLSMKGDLHGDYFPLHGSRSFAAKPHGMTHAKEEELRSCGNLFQEPDSTLLLASGMARCWPDGRGVFHNDDSNLFVWVGEEDHMRIVSMQGDMNTACCDYKDGVGKRIKEVVARFIRACDVVGKVLKANGADFMNNEHLGWVLTCPSNLGTGLRCGSMVTLPKVSARPDWRALILSMRLQARGKGGVDAEQKGGLFDISNLDRIGKGEITLVNVLITGLAQLVKWEMLYDAGKGDEADKQIKAHLAGKGGETTGKKQTSTEAACGGAKGCKMFKKGAMVVAVVAAAAAFAYYYSQSKRKGKASRK